MLNRQSMPRRAVFAGSLGLALTALGLGTHDASARKGTCGKKLYFCPGKQNVICGFNNKAQCFRKGHYMGEAQRV